MNARKEIYNFIRSPGMDGIYGKIIIPIRALHFENIYFSNLGKVRIDRNRFGIINNIVEGINERAKMQNL